MAPQKLKIAAAGLGRMGKRHAINFLNRTPRAELVAAFTPDPEEMAWAKVNLEPHGVTLYDDYQKMIEQPGLQAVVIGTATSVHAEEAIQAMQKDLHVLCEKPLSTSIEIVSTIYRILGYANLSVPRCCERGQEAPSPQGHVWLFSTIRSVLPRRPREDGAGCHRPTYNHPKPDL